MKNAVLVLIIIATVMLGMTIFQRSLIYLPHRGVVEPAKWHAADMQIVQLTTADHLINQAWYKPAKSNLPTIVYFHGNAGHLGYRVPLIKPYLSKGYGVLLLSYRGYANNQGSPTEQGLYNDARAAINFLRAKTIKPQCIVLYGESLGSGVAVQMASEYSIGALILQAPYTSLVDMAIQHYFFYPAKWLLWDKFDSYSKIKQIKAPLLIMHGSADRIVPIKQSQRLFSRANFPKQAKYFANNGHNDLNADKLSVTVTKFLSQHLACTELMTPQ